MSDPISDIIRISQSGTYVLELHEAKNGCSTSESVEVFDNRLVSFKFDLVEPICDNLTASLLFLSVSGGNPPYSYSIDNGMTYSENPFFGEMQPGVYFITVADEDDCRIERAICIPEIILLDFDLPTGLRIQLGYLTTIPVTLSAPDSLIEKISWTPEEGLSCVDCLSPIVEVNK